MVGYGAIWLFLRFFQFWSFSIECDCRQVIISMTIIVITYEWKHSELRTNYRKLLDDLAPQNGWLWRYLVDFAYLSLF